MIDSNDSIQPSKKSELVEESKANEVSNVNTEATVKEETIEKQNETTSRFTTKQEVLSQLKELAQNADSVNKQELDNLKQTFYKIHNAELEEKKKDEASSNEGENETENVVVVADPLEEEFKSLMSVIKEKRSAQTAKVEKEKEEIGRAHV